MATHQAEGIATLKQVQSGRDLDVRLRELTDEIARPALVITVRAIFASVTAPVCPLANMPVRNRTLNHARQYE
jgi:hypothetical protein